MDQCSYSSVHYYLFYFFHIITLYQLPSHNTLKYQPKCRFSLRKDWFFYVPVDVLSRIQYRAFQGKPDWHRNEKEGYFDVVGNARLFFAIFYKTKIRMSYSLYLFGLVILIINGIQILSALLHRLNRWFPLDITERPVFLLVMLDVETIDSYGPYRRVYRIFDNFPNPMSPWRSRTVIDWFWLI